MDRPLNRRQRAKALTQSKVLEGARELFEQVGYEAATIRDIAARIGMSTGAIFANYEDKAALYLAAYGHAPITPEQGRLLHRALIKSRWYVADHQDAQPNDESLADLMMVDQALALIGEDA